LAAATLHRFSLGRDNYASFRCVKGFMDQEASEKILSKWFSGFGLKIRH